MLYSKCPNLKFSVPPLRLCGERFPKSYVHHRDTESTEVSQSKPIQLQEQVIVSTVKVESSLRLLECIF